MVKTLPSSAAGEGSIPSQRTEIPHALQPKNQNINQKQYCNKFNKDLKKKSKFGIPTLTQVQTDPWCWLSFKDKFLTEGSTVSPELNG